MKRCTKCGEEKELSAFYKASVASGGGLRRRCILCTRADNNERNRRNKTRRSKTHRRWYMKNKARRLAKAKEWTVKNKKRHVGLIRRHKTGWTEEMFERAWLAQQGRCAICLTKMASRGHAKNSVNADHCHKSGKQRALLCKMCNTGLGCFDDDPIRLAAASNYVKLFSEESSRSSQSTRPELQN